MTTDSTSTVLQQRGAATWTRATEHPMVKEIATGVLPHSTFRRYFEQNILYLEEYVRAIGLTIGKAPDHDAMVVLGRFLLQIADLEIPANHDFLTRLGGDPSTLDHHQMNATTHGYTRHLLHVAGSGDCAAGLTAILPCQWSYGALARPLMESLPGDPIYDDWIAMFGSDDYDDLVGLTTSLLDRSVDPSDATRMDELAWIFDVSTRYEEQFWQMAYTGLGWGD